MKLQRFPLLFLAVLTIAPFLSTSTQAGPLSGDYVKTFSSEVQIWDPSGSYDENFDEEGIDLDFSMSVDSQGKIVGSGTFSFPDLWQEGIHGYINGVVTVTGKVSSSGSVTRVTYKIRISGGGMVDGYPVEFMANLSIKAEIDPQFGEMVGTVSGKLQARMPGEGSETIKVPPTYFETPLPEGMDGGCTLHLNNLSPDASGKKINGSGRMELSNGKILLFSVSGKYNQKKDEAKLALRGGAGNEKSKLSISASANGALLNVHALKGKTLGQKIQVNSR